MECTPSPALPLDRTTNDSGPVYNNLWIFRAVRAIPSAFRNPPDILRQSVFFMRQLYLFTATLLVSLACGAGCRDQETIVRYRVPKQESAEAQESQEMLIALTERNGIVYFFKTVGPKDRIDACRDAVRSFLATIRFPTAGKSGPTWQLPDNWTEKKGTGMRLATLSLDKTSRPLLLAVSSLRQSNPNWNVYLTTNLNRWRGQMGLEPVTEKMAIQSFETFDVDGQTLYLTRIKSANGSATPNPVARRKQPTASLTGFDTANVQGTPPPEWEPGPVTGMRKACFRMQSDDQSLEVTVIQAGGDLLANVNRWRGQIKLTPISQEQLAKSITEIKAGSLKGEYVALAGARETILVAVFPAATGNSWFVKLRGDQSIAEKQTNAFKSFVSSLRFGPESQ